MSAQIKIAFYEDWMLDQICELFVEQYQVNFESFRTNFIKFYDGDFQKNDCVRIVSLDDSKVVGFQSFFLWPYRCNGTVYRSYQSGNSIVALTHRGQGLFQRMLNFADENMDLLKIDFMVGFPVAASYKSFIKCGWNNILDLQWIVSLVNPLGIFFNAELDFFEKSNSFFRTDANIVANQNPTSSEIWLEKGKAFADWRKSFSDKPGFYFEFHYEQQSVLFELKINTRGKIHECVIGRISGQTINHQLLKKAVSNLKATLRTEAPFVSILSIASNPNHAHFSMIQNAMGYFSKTLNRKIHFIIKHARDSELNHPANWELYRSDIDTW